MISPCKPLPRHLLDLLASQVDVKGTALRIHTHHHLLAGERLLDGIGLQINRHAAMRIDLACEGLAIDGYEPVVGIDVLRKCWQGWQGGMSDTRGSIAARASPFVVSPDWNAA
jgi:hypothetical protein